MSQKNEGALLEIPFSLSLIVLLFLLSSVVSSVLSPNIQRSFEYTAYWFVVFLILMLFYNMRTKQTMKIIFHGVIILGCIFSLYSVFLKYLLPETWTILIPQHMFQYIADPFKTHNPLGIFLLLPLSMLLPSWTEKNKKKERIVFVVLFGFLVFSYTRAAYATFALITCFFVMFEIFIKRRRLTKRVYILLGSLVILSILLSFVIAWFENGPEWYVKIHDFFVEILRMPRYKGFISARNHFGLQAIYGILEKPWFGWGPDNLFYASIKYTPIIKLTTNVSENLFLDIFAEQGIVGGVLFFIILGLMFLRSFIAVKRSDNVLDQRYFLAFTAILILMMGDTIKRNYVYFMLFFVLGSFIYRERQNIKTHFNIFLFPSIILFVFIFLKVNSQFFFSIGRPLFAQSIYPLNEEVYPTIIYESYKKNDVEAQQRWTDTYLHFFPGDQQALIVAGNTYMNFDKPQALHYYLKAYEVSPLKEFELVTTIYYLKKEIEGKSSAKDFLFSHIDTYLLSKQWAKDHKYRNSSREGNIMYICVEEGFDCRFVYK
ncbi:MAG: hypothetical protein US54_C0051G0004 [Candidatus Roizmanbacteria bacterium GW2011_GWA2_37_7]|uniref:O-antigen ligase-related domain-containing protein n=1 Tax=Candidatus Roizmanbacteria bacterium GW2011_GWA2_37_7 TaxID=1618481 RepID=A0A0G0H0Y3_9BACT|nr:MAG: hypothetical protein US54_C0051G0004 [Candidatus Roizmanbacteria bacterium GW2011_GWA2_37_7]